jgi:calcineurin-like phosphoesterase family protein
VSDAKSNQNTRKARDVWFSSDHHLGHRNILNFKKSDESPLRVFNSIEEHDDFLIQASNEVVKPEDKIYFLGDVCINNKFLHLVTKFNGSKRLVRGNHDIFKTVEYQKVGFTEIYGTRVFTPKETGGVFFVATHVPTHTSSLYRWTANVHGHTHSNNVMLDGEVDSRYICVCMEQLDNYRPVHLDEIVSRVKELNLPEGSY